jgi:hypothetical protein
MPAKTDTVEYNPRTGGRHMIDRGDNNVRIPQADPLLKRLYKNYGNRRYDSVIIKERITSLGKNE